MAVYIVQNESTLENPETISTDHFGANLLLTQDVELIDPDSNMLQDLDALGVNTIRFPGGSVTEEIFNPNYPNTSFNYKSGTQIIALEDFFFALTGSNHDVNLVVPTSNAFTYSAGEAALLPSDHAQKYGSRTEISEEFIGSPYTGGLEYDSEGNAIPQGAELKVDGILGYVSYSLQLADANNIEIKTIEIGNEFWGSGQMTASEYGLVAGVVAVELNNLLESPEYSHHDVEIIVQSTSAASALYSPKNDVSAYVAEIEGEMQIISNDLINKTTEKGGYNGEVDPSWQLITIPGQGGSNRQSDDIVTALNSVEGAGDSIDGVTVHYYESSGLDSFSADGSSSGPDNSKGPTFDNLHRFNTDLERNSDEELSFHITEWNARENDIFGLKHASMMVELFFELTSNGVDSAQTWPLTFDHQLRSLTDIDNP